jgi:hypothetical protein
MVLQVKQMPHLVFMQQSRLMLERKIKQLAQVHIMILLIKLILTISVMALERVQMPMFNH